MKTTLIICTAAKGGMRAVVEGYRSSGLFDEWQVEWLAPHHDSSAIERAWVAIRTYAAFVARLVSGNVGLVHCHVAMRGSFWRKSAFALTARVAGVPVIFHLHGSETDKFYVAQPVLLQRLISWILTRVSLVVVLSESWRQFVLSVSPSANVEVVPNYVRTTPLSALPPAAVPSTRATVTFLFLGAVGHRKGIYDLLPAFARARADHPSIRLVIGGNGELEQAKQLAEQLAITDVVDFAGWVSGSTKDALLASADVYLLPSFNEGMPVSILEAMSQGLPIVSTKVGGIPELVRDGIDGRLIAPGDVAALARCISELASSPALRHQMGRAGRERVSAGFSEESVVPRLRAIYARLALK